MTAFFCLGFCGISCLIILLLIYLWPYVRIFKNSLWLCLAVLLFFYTKIAQKIEQCSGTEIKSHLFQNNFIRVVKAKARFQERRTQTEATLGKHTWVKSHLGLQPQCLSISVDIPRVRGQTIIFCLAFTYHKMS